jgi:hypothetical protein
MRPGSLCSAGGGSGTSPVASGKGTESKAEAEQGQQRSPQVVQVAGIVIRDRRWMEAKSESCSEAGTGNDDPVTL